MDWLRRNPTAIPWVLLGADIGLRIGAQIYKTYHGYYHDETVDDSPIQSLLPGLTQQETVDLPYPPDAYPGARDVTSSYGSLRIYEWGPDEGRKVILIHGITNPCVALGAVAQGLVDRGCRVILFDLPGRGYSSSPSQIPQSVRFFSTCILLALTSSPISWTGGSNRFTLIGYSLGGGIATDFASHFPTLLSSLILLAPGGLIRSTQINFTNKLLYHSGLLNETLVQKIVTQRLESGAPPVALGKPSPPEKNPASAEVPNSVGLEIPPPSNRYPNIDISPLTTWQLQVNRGFVPAYISSVRYGPITNQHDSWTRLGQKLKTQNLNTSIGSTNLAEGLRAGKVLIVCGKTDELVLANELREDAAQCLGEENFEYKVVDAGHDLTVTRSREIVELIFEFWAK